jgi:hypothetical protein
MKEEIIGPREPSIVRPYVKRGPDAEEFWQSVDIAFDFIFQLKDILKTSPKIDFIYFEKTVNYSENDNSTT